MLNILIITKDLYNRFSSVYLISSLIGYLKKTLGFTAFIRNAYMKVILFNIFHPVLTYIIIFLTLFMIRAYFFNIVYAAETESILNANKNPCRLNYGLGHALQSNVHASKSHNPPHNHLPEGTGLGVVLDSQLNYYTNKISWSVPFHPNAELVQMIDLFYSFSNTTATTNPDLVVKNALTFMQTEMPENIWSTSPAMRYDLSAPIHKFLNHLLYNVKPKTPNELMNAIYFKSAIIAFDLINYNQPDIETQFKINFNDTFNAIYQTHRYHYENL